MDIAFAPGASDEEREWARILKFRPETRVFSYDGALCQTKCTLSHFLDQLDGLVPQGSPPRRLILSSHGDPTGYLSIPLERQGENITYESMLEYVWNKPGQPLYSGRNEFDVFIWACDYGVRPQPSAALKTILGRQAKSIISSRFPSVALVHEDGVLDYLTYDFSIGAKQLLQDRAKFLDLLWERASQYDGSDIPDDIWEAIEAAVPAEFSTEDQGSAALDLTYQARRQGVVEHRIYESGVYYECVMDEIEPWEINLADGDAPARDNHALLREAIESYDRSWSDGLPDELIYPYYQRKGFEDIQAYMDGYDWSFRPSADRTKVLAAGSRCIHRIEFPIARASGGGRELLCNWWPLEEGGSAVAGLSDEEALLYFTYTGQGP